MKKDKLFFKNKLESFIYEEMDDTRYEVIRIDSSKLLTWNRFDLAFKLFYLEIRYKNSDLAVKIYEEDIRCQTASQFSEFGNKNKNSFIAYVEEFDKIFNSIKVNGFEEQKSIIPLSSNGTVGNGAHRTSCAIFLNEEVSCVKLNLNENICDYKFYYERNVSTDILNLIATKFIDYSLNTYVAFLWPSGSSNTKKVQECFSNVVYKTDIMLNINGAFNLLHELYKHMDWIGSSNNNFEGIQQKIVECFPNFETFKVVVFQADSLEDVREVKEKVRNICNIGFSSIHITDTKEEATRISKLILNENGLHFLNYAHPYKFTSFKLKQNKFTDFITLNKLNVDDIILDSSTLMELYGIRESNDIDYLAFDNAMITSKVVDIEEHSEELVYHDEKKIDLLYNPKFHFYYQNMKFISFTQLHRMKLNRNGVKDRNDINMMNAFIENNSLKMMKTSFYQFLLYTKVKFRQSVILGLKKIGLYNNMKRMYDKYLRK